MLIHSKPFVIYLIRLSYLFDKLTTTWQKKWDMTFSHENDNTVLMPKNVPTNACNVIHAANIRKPYGRTITDDQPQQKYSTPFVLNPITLPSQRDQAFSLQDAHTCIPAFLFHTGHFKQYTLIQLIIHNMLTIKSSWTMPHKNIHV